MSIFFGGEVVVLRELFRKVPDNPKNHCNECSFQSFGCQAYHLNWFFITLGTCVPKQKWHIYFCVFLCSPTSFPCHCWYTPELTIFSPLNESKKFFEVDKNVQPRKPFKMMGKPFVRNLLVFSSREKKPTPHFQSSNPLGFFSFNPSKKTGQLHCDQPLSLRSASFL